MQTLQRQAKTKNEFGYEIDATPADLVKYLFSKRGSYRPKTFLGYRTALLWWLAKLPINEEVRKAWELLHSPLPADGYKGAGEKQDASIYSQRSMRKRNVPKRNLNKLLGELTARAEKGRTVVERNRATELRFWVRAGLATGLRPTEWQQAFWKSKSEGELYVINAKRKLDNYALPNISHLSDDRLEQMRIVIVKGEDIHWVDAHLKSVQAHLAKKKPFDSYYLNNRMYLQNICKRIFNLSSRNSTSKRPLRSYGRLVVEFREERLNK